MAEVWHAGTQWETATDHRPERTGEAMSVTMNREEREQFLAGVHVAVLSAASADGDGYVSANPTGGQIAFRMTPERWLTVDYSKVYGETADDSSL
jgi:hypothetical protein